MKSKAILIVAAAFAMSCSGPKDGTYSFRILTTNDIHGAYFDSTYTGTDVKRSLAAVKYTVDSVRNAAGADNVILLDAGDMLQGDNAAYFFDFVDTLAPHVYPRMAKYMGYDAVVLGNHDIETGHACYDRVASELEGLGIPCLSGNAIRNDNGQPYFPYYTILKRHGIKIAVLGYNNSNIKNWLSERLWSGMTFKNLIPLVQEDVDKVISSEKPHLVIVAVHSATGSGDGSQLESQGLDLMQSLRGVDFLICSHDHKPVVIERDTLCLINSGSHCRYLGLGEISFEIRKGKISGKKHSAGLIPVDRLKVDQNMDKEFHEDYLKVKDFSTREVGELMVDLKMRDAYRGMCDYLNLLHTISLGCHPADISIAAPLSYDGFVKSGTLIYNDLFTIYPYENQLYVLRMTGSEVKNYLEESYDLWINTVSGPGDHVLKIANTNDPRTGQKAWSFIERSYNFDSAAGLIYTVDVTKEKGERVVIVSMADGRPFEAEMDYNVAMTSYRAAGGGGLLKLCGIDTGRIEERIVETFPEIRDILYDYLQRNGSIDPKKIGDRAVLGHWEFIPGKVVTPAMDKDLALLFGVR